MIFHKITPAGKPNEVLKLIAVDKMLFAEAHAATNNTVTLRFAFAGHTDMLLENLTPLEATSLLAEIGRISLPGAT